MCPQLFPAPTQILPYAMAHVLYVTHCSPLPLCPPLPLSALFFICSTSSPALPSSLSGRNILSSSWARVFMLASFSRSMSMAQVAGCLPLPSSHSLSIAAQQSMGCSWCSLAMRSRVRPISSKSRRIPRSLHLVPMVLMISTLFPEGDLRSTSCWRVGL